MTGIKKNSLMISLLICLSSMNSYAQEVPQNQQLVGSHGRSIDDDYSFKMSLSNPNKLYLRTGQSFFSSIDTGEHWNRVKPSFEEGHDVTLFSGELMVDPVNANILFSGFRSDEINYRFGRFRSLDGGVHWKSYVPSGREYGHNISVFLTYPLYEPRPISFPLLVASMRDRSSQQSFYISSDGGNMWSFSGAGGYIGDTLESIDPHNHNILHMKKYSVQEKRRVDQKSSDGGKTWVDIIADDSISYTLLRMHPANHNVFFAMNNEEDNPFVAKSYNNGKDWTTLAPLSNGYVFSDFRLSSTDVNTIYALAHKPESDYSEITIVKSTNAGDSWIFQSTGFFFHRKESKATFIVHPKNHQILFLATPEHGIISSTNGGQDWKPSNTGIQQLSEKSKNCLFTWAEQQFSQLFSPVGVQSEVIKDYTYRYYNQSNNYLGFFQDKNIHFLQPSVSAEIQDVGSVKHYQNLSGCY